MANLSSEEARLKNVENAGIASLQLQTKGATSNVPNLSVKTYLYLFFTSLIFLEFL